MLNQSAVCIASMLMLVPGSDCLAAGPVRVAATPGECPSEVAQQVKAIAEKACKRQGGEAVITYLSCVDGVATASWDCV